jgi:hypothetical protein
MFGIVVDHFEITPSALLFMARNGHLEGGVWYWEELQDPSAAVPHFLDEGEGMLRRDAAQSGFYDTNPYYEGGCPYITCTGETLCIVDPDAPSIGGENLIPITR